MYTGNKDLSFSDTKKPHTTYMYMLETLDYTICIGSTPTILYLYTIRVAYLHDANFTIKSLRWTCIEYFEVNREYVLNTGKSGFTHLQVDLNLLSGERCYRLNIQTSK